MTDNKFSISMDDEHINKLDAMVKADDTDRSKFLRKLIRREWDFREQNGIIAIQELPHPTDAQPVPLVMINK